MKSRIMKRAHELARQSNTADYRTALSRALKKIYWMIEHQDRCYDMAVNC